MASRKTTGFATEEAPAVTENAQQMITLENFKIEQYEIQDLGNKRPIGYFHPARGA